MKIADVKMYPNVIRVTECFVGQSAILKGCDQPIVRHRGFPATWERVARQATTAAA